MCVSKKLELVKKELLNSFQESINNKKKGKWRASGIDVSPSGFLCVTLVYTTGQMWVSKEKNGNHLYVYTNYDREWVWIPTEGDSELLKAFQELLVVCGGIEKEEELDKILNFLK